MTSGDGNGVAVGETLGLGVAVGLGERDTLRVGLTVGLVVGFGVAAIVGEGATCWIFGAGAEPPLW